MSIPQDFTARQEGETTVDTGCISNCGKKDGRMKASLYLTSSPKYLMLPKPLRILLAEQTGIESKKY